MAYITAPGPQPHFKGMVPPDDGLSDILDSVTTTPLSTIVGRIIICCMIHLLEPSSRARMCYKNCLKSCLYSIKQDLEIILRGAKYRASEVPQMSLQLFHKILLIRMILMV